jgi:sigma-B regulation protein RsbU (phosphoserine phosphatase)
MKATSRGGTLANHGGFEAYVSDPITPAPVITSPAEDELAAAAEARGIAPEQSSLERSDLAGAFALLAKMTQDFAVSMDIETTLERALAMIAAHLDAEAGSLWLVESEATEIACHACVGPHPITGLRLPVTEGIVGRSVRENLCQRVLDVAKDPHFSQTMDAQSGFVTRSILCAPMRLSDRAIGAIEVINRRGGDGRFAESDAHLLQVLASSAALAIANARMAESLVEAERTRRELELAAEIQRTLLPQPRPDPFPVCGVNLPARTVSGDFYDILPLEGSRIAFCLGDVAGKGMNAALLMAKTASLYRCLAKTTPSPGALLAALDREISETATRGMFVTMLAGLYDPERGEVTLANAGHEPALLHNLDGEFTSLPANAPPLGILAGGDFPEVRVEMKGGTLYVCSDGLTEAACSETREQLGSEGLKRLVRRFAEKPLSARIAAITSEVGRLELRDDLTLLAVSDERGRR